MLKKLINYYFFNNDSKLYYLKKIKKVLKYSKYNYGFITYDLFFFFFLRCKFSDLKNILKILKKLKIKIYNEIPENDSLFLNEYNKNFKLKTKNKDQKNYFFNNLFFKKIKNIKRLNNKEINFEYIKIKSLNNFLSFFLNKFLSIKIYLLKSKKIFNNSIIEDILIPFFKKYFSENDFFEEIKLKKSFKCFFNNKDFVEREEEILSNINEEDQSTKTGSFPKEELEKKYIFYLKIFLKILKKNKKKVYFKKIINELISLINMNSNSINIIFKIFLKKINKINKIKSEIYDIFINISKLSYIKYNFYFIKYGFNLHWLINLINFKKFNKKLIKEIKDFIYKKSKILKKIENEMQMKIKNIIKIYLVIKINKFKIDLIKKKIIINSLYITKNVCNKYYKKDFYIDTIQEGIIGLIKLVNNYSYNKNEEFLKLAYYSVKNSVSKFLYSNKLIRLPNYIITLIRLINQITENYKLNYNKNPNIKYLSEKINMPEKKLLQILNSVKNPISLEKEIYENTKLEEIITDKIEISAEKLILNQEIKNSFNKIFLKLKEKYVKVLFMRYGMDFYKKETLQKIGQRFNLSKERIRQIQNIVLTKLRHPERSNKLKKFFTPKFK